MYFLEAISICEMRELNPIWEVVGFIVKAIWFGVPILLIIFGMIDLGKAVIASKEDEIKKATKAFGKRFLYAVAVFLVVWLVRTVLNLTARIAGTDVDGNNVIDNQGGWEECWKKIA